MRWISFEKDGRASFGRVVDDGVADTGASGYPPVFMDDGDVAEVEIDSIGTLRNHVALD